MSEALTHGAGSTTEMDGAIRVVIVDDAADLRLLLVRVLSRDPRLHVVADVGNGQLAIDAVREHQPDVVLMDVSMPVMDGMTATRTLREQHPDLRIIMLTGYGDDRVADEARAAGADDFLDKTLALDVVADTIVRVVRG